MTVCCRNAAEAGAEVSVDAGRWFAAAAQSPLEEALWSRGNFRVGTALTANEQARAVAAKKELMNRMMEELKAADKGSTEAQEIALQQARLFDFLYQSGAYADKKEAQDAAGVTWALLSSLPRLRADVASAAEVVARIAGVESELAGKRATPETVAAEKRAALAKYLELAQAADGKQTRAELLEQATGIKFGEAQAEENRPGGNDKNALYQSDDAEIANSPAAQLQYAEDELFNRTPEQQLEAVRARYEGTGQWMKAPNGKKTNLTERQWLQARTPAFKRWFGDWEAAAKARLLRGKTVAANVKRGQIPMGPAKDVREAAARWITDNVKGPVPTVIGEVALDGNAMADSISHGYGQAKLDAIPAIESVLRDGTYLGEMADFDGKPMTNHFFAGKVAYADGAEKIVFARVRKATGTGNRFYVHEVFTEEELGEGKNAGKPHQTGASASGKRIRGASLYANILRGVLNVNEENVSKVVDENGEPRVVYHGTGAEFDAFQLHRPGVIGDVKSAFFTSDKAMAATYGGNVMAAFLNVRNLAEVDAHGQSALLRDVDLTEEEEAAVAKLWGEGWNPERGLTADQVAYAKQKGGHDGVVFHDMDDRADLRGGQASDVFAVLKSPRQIKSATDNSGAFDPAQDSILMQAGRPGAGAPWFQKFLVSELAGPGDAREGRAPARPDERELVPPLFQSIGEQGAARLDALEAKASEGGRRLEALRTAREMEGAGKDAKAIRLATGWEKGKDGKWRWEIPDLAVRPGAKVKKDGSSTLPDVIDAPELFAAYPRLRGVRLVRDAANRFTQARAAYHADADGNAEIRLYEESLKFATPEEIRAVLAHEVQHAIQDLEGFAKGGNGGALAWANADPARQKALRDEYRRLLAESRKPLTLEEYARSAWGGDAITPEIRKGYHEYVKGIKNPGRAVLVALQEQAASNVYRRLAGEVEARNAERRMGMTAEERRATLLAETEDVAREDQIVMLDGQSAMMAMEESEQAESDFAMLGEVLKTGKETAVQHRELGNIAIRIGDTGNETSNGKGLKHIIDHRAAQGWSVDQITFMLHQIVDALRYGEVGKTKQADRLMLKLGGATAIVAKDGRGRWLLTGFAEDKEATDSIFAGIAGYRYAPSFSDLRKEVGAVMASLGYKVPETTDFVKRQNPERLFHPAMPNSELSSGLPQLSAQDMEEKRGYTVTAGDGDIVIGGDVMANGTHIINLLGKADASTFIHEMGHIWLRELEAAVAGGNATENAREMLATVKAWTQRYQGLPGADAIVPGSGFTVYEHEAFAKALELYLREGQAPTPGLRRVFAAIRAWLAQNENEDVMMANSAA